MRKITQDAISAFYNNQAFKQGNTQVALITEGVQLKLHGHIIAELNQGEVFIDSCGYMTPTTKERLNGLKGVNIVQKKGLWYLNGNEWNGNIIKVK